MGGPTDAGIAPKGHWETVHKKLGQQLAAIDLESNVVSGDVGCNGSWKSQCVSAGNTNVALRHG